MKRLLVAALAALSLLAPSLGSAGQSSSFAYKTPLRYHVCTYTFSTTADVVAANVCTLPPGGAILRDAVIYQVGAGVGGTSWVAGPKRATLALTSTNGGFTLAAGANRVTNVNGSRMGTLSNPTGGTRPVISGSVAAYGTVTISAGLAAGEIATVNGVAFTSVASGALGNQFNVGADENAAATNLAAAINASTSSEIKGRVTAAAATNVVTITARNPGSAENAIPLVVSGAHLARSAATFANGFDAMSTTGGELVTMDVTLTGTYTGAVSGVVSLFFEPRN
jgi:hypothetical protein